MVEETKVEEKVVVSEKEMAEVNEKIESVEQEKLDAAKAEGKEIAEKDQTISTLEAELKALKEANEKADREREEEQKRIDLQAQIAAEKAKAEEPVKKHLVPQNNNPTVAKTVAEPEVELSPARQMDELEMAVRRGGFTATYEE